MTLASCSHNASSGLVSTRGGWCVQSPPQVAVTSRPAHRSHPSSAPPRPPCPPAGSLGLRPTRSASTTGGGGSSGAGADTPGSRVAVSAVGASYDRGAPAPYKWSWQDDSEPAAALELDASVVAAASSVQDLTAALLTAAAAGPPRATLTTPSRTLLACAVQRLLLPGATASVADAAQLLQAYGAVSQGTVVSTAATDADTASSDAAAAAPRIAASVLSYVCSITAGDGAAAAVQSAPARDLADLLWALSELQEYDLPWDARTTAAVATAASAAALEAAVAAEAPAALQRAVLARVRGQDFLAPDVCRVVCALGSLAVVPTASAASTSGSTTGQQAAAGRGGFVVDPAVVSALNEEVRYQLTEFAADFEAADLGRLISGMAGLRLGAAVACDEEYRRILMKAVYGKTRSLADKAAVDFALSRLMSDDPEARSMHYDSRWTHEELRWLPRRERDKRRILKEGWYRTKWGGWSPGGEGGAA